MPGLSTTYLLPAILLNPAFILHLINTFISHIVPSPPSISHSPHPFMESIGPVPGSTPYWDMHTDEALCWRYTAIMVVVQVLAFGRVQDNRVQRRDRRAAKAERERTRREVECVGERRDVKSVGLDGALDSTDEGVSFHALANEKSNGIVNGAATTIERSETAIQTEGLETESEASLTEMSEEEMMI